MHQKITTAQYQEKNPLNQHNLTWIYLLVIAQTVKINARCQFHKPIHNSFLFKLNRCEIDLGFVYGT